jgi:uncharacterized membrane protein YeaQ/YmgE (transglycosylase-associated protein family)
MSKMLSILWTIIIGFIAGVIAKFVTPGEKEPQGFNCPMSDEAVKRAV